MKKIATLLASCIAGLSAFSQPCIPNTKSLKFDGTSTYVELGTAAALAPDSAITVEAWIKPSVFASLSYQNTIVSKDGWSSGEGGFVLRCGGNGILSFNIAGKTFGGVSSSWKEVLSPASAITLNTWTHVAGTFDGATIKCFVNGVQVGSMAYAGTIDKNALYITKVGRLADNQPGQGRFFNGYIDEVRIWERALTAAELLANKNDHLDPSGQSRLRGYWRFNEGAGTTTTDIGTGSNNGTITAGVWDNSVPFNAGVVSSAIVGSLSVAPGASSNYSVTMQTGNTYTWTPINGTVTSGQGTNSVTVQWGSVGSASLILIESKGACYDSSGVNLWVGTVGIADVENKKSLMLAPNPVKDKATFTLANSSNASIKIMDMLGNEVMLMNSEGRSSITFNRSSLKSGIYFYQVNDEKRILATGKMIVE